MSIHRAVWTITFAVVAIAAIILAFRHHAQAGYYKPVFAMVEALDRDPYLEDAATRDAIKAASISAIEHGLVSAEAWLAIGLQQMEEKDFENAESAFHNAIALSPEWNWPYNQLGVLLANHAKHREDEAERALKTARRLAPESGRAYNDLAILYRLHKRYSEADRAARRALELSPDSAAVHNTYGNLLTARHHYKDAEAHFRKAISLSPLHPRPFYNLACLYSIQGRKKNALPLLQQAIEREPALQKEARTDPDLAALRNDATFKKLVNPPAKKIQKPGENDGD